MIYYLWHPIYTAETPITMSCLAHQTYCDSCIFLYRQTRFATKARIMVNMSEQEVRYGTGQDRTGQDRTGQDIGFYYGEHDKNKRDDEL